MWKYCDSTRETLTHMFFDCPKVKQFWLKVIDWWNKKRVDDVTVTSSDILYGYKPESTSFYSFNHHLLIVKFFIIQAKQTNHSSSFEAFYIFLNDKIRSEKEIAVRSNKLMKYTSKWTTLCDCIIILYNLSMSICARLLHPSSSIFYDLVSFFVCFSCFFLLFRFRGLCVFLFLPAIQESNFK